MISNSLVIKSTLALRKGYRVVKKVGAVALAKEGCLGLCLLDNRGGSIVSNRPSARFRRGLP